ncbi:MAG: methionine--tRNA ligase [Rickettsiales bacterium]|nr:methionine--tRNA ligase [Rickettsiales bacterium]
MNKNIFITTPIYYVNSEPHIGGVYTTLMADIINKFHQLNGKNTRFLTGTDEHGQKIQQSAEKAGIKEQEFVDKVSKTFRDVADYMKFNYDDFIRTTEIRHIKFVQQIWQQLVKNDWLYKGKYEGWYCISDEAYYTEDELIKQEDGSFKTTLGKSVEWKEEESYFFRLSEFQEILLDLYKNTNFIQPKSRKNEVIAFVGGNNIKEIENGNFTKGFLKDLSVSRNNFSWGIKIPCNCKNKELLQDFNTWKNDIKDTEKHVVYVWLDALFNYQSALESFHKLEDFWNNADVIHLVGKDILRFHAVYWPAFLIAVKYHRNELKSVNIQDILKANILPKNVFAHGWWTNEGKKISKSLGNAISAKSEIKWLMTDFGITEDIAIDYLKYYLATETQFGNDGDYSRNRLVEKINAELVNNIGNLIQRVLSMVYKNLEGKINCNNFIEVTDLEDKLINKTINVFDFQEYKDLILQISNDANNYMEEKAPWNLKKEGKIEELKEVLYNEIENIRKIVILLQPLCPYITSKIIEFLQLKNVDFSALFHNKYLLKDLVITEPVGFFPRLQKR